MSLRFHEIAEGHNRILNPLSAEKLALIGEICQFEEGMRLLDLGCGKGEALAQWAQRHSIRGVGVDISEVFLQAARERAYDMDVEDKLNFVQGDATDYPEPHHQFDAVVCLGVTWIGGGLSGTMALMQQALKPEGGLLVVGEPFWYETPPPEALQALDAEADTFTTLAGTLDRFEKAGLELVEMVLGRRDEFDRYEAPQWMAVHTYLSENPDDPEADALRRWIQDNRRTYLQWGRDYMGWGVFVLHVPGSEESMTRSTAAAGETTRPAEPQGFQPTGLYFTDDKLWLQLADGRVIGTPLTWFPWLVEADTSTRESFELASDTVRWPGLNGEISVEALLKPRSG